MSVINKAGQTERQTIAIFRVLRLIWERAPVVGNLAPLVSSCSLLVSNDMDVSHLAAALKTPSPIIFSAPDHDRWAPDDRFLHKTLQHTMSWTADEVLLQADRHLKEVHSHA